MHKYFECATVWHRRQRPCSNSKIIFLFVDEYFRNRSTLNLRSILLPSYNMYSGCAVLRLLCVYVCMRQTKLCSASLAQWKMKWMKNEKRKIWRKKNSGCMHTQILEQSTELRAELKIVNERTEQAFVQFTRKLVCTDSHTDTHTKMYRFRICVQFVHAEVNKRCCSNIQMRRTKQAKEGKKNWREKWKKNNSRRAQFKMLVITK